ncbi:Uncharacterized protein T01_8642 [Trichinella spiralis]|uniref:Large ribosomal subunit protein mL44 n=1 Tax=Trichinella spiralis TaxID=6334 RepID=A0A0V1BS38_TRISP|nr:Uncharacterized protein T01_8642 [Trichinella spiralis]
MSSKAIKEMAWSPALFFIKRYLASLSVVRDDAASHNAMSAAARNLWRQSKRQYVVTVTTRGKWQKRQNLPRVGVVVLVKDCDTLSVHLAALPRSSLELMAWCEIMGSAHQVGDVGNFLNGNGAYCLNVNKTMTFFPMPFSLIGRILSERIVTLRTISCRYKKKWYRDYIRDLWGRRVLLGPDKDVPRSSFPSWNYNAELFALKSRIGTNLNDDTLRRALIDRSYVIREIDERKQLLDASSNVEFASSVLTDIQDNTDFIRKAAHDFITSEEKLAKISRQLGIYDLLMADNFPYNNSLMSSSLRSIVGAILFDGNEAEAGYFVQDFVLTQLINVDINELWYFKEPLKILTALLEKNDRGTPEPRILRSSGEFTVTPVYVVGIYCDKKLIAAGESVLIATEMAARDCLKNLWGLTEKSMKFKFGEQGRQIDLHDFYEMPNQSLNSQLNFKIELSDDLYKEPLTPQQLTIKYKREIEKTIGTPYRRRLWHFFYPGTLHKTSPRRFIAPKAKTI